AARFQYRPAAGGTCLRPGSFDSRYLTGPARSPDPTVTSGAAQLGPRRYNRRSPPIFRCPLRPCQGQGGRSPFMQIGPWQLPNNVVVAPMAGVAARPFRQLCRRLGAGHAVSERAASNPRLWHSVKTSRRLDHTGESEPIAVQIAGADPAMMAEAAVF